MFEEHMKHETALIGKWSSNLKLKPLNERIRLYRIGAQPSLKRHRLDAKIDRIYPRGPAFQRFLLGE